jgi:hypothetical protein
VPVKRSETQNDYLRLKAANGPHHVAQNLFARPFRAQCFIGGLSESKVDGPREVLLGAIDAAGGEQFLSSNDSQFVALLRANQVLSALATSER